MSDPRPTRRNLLKTLGYGAAASIPLVGWADREAYDVRIQEVDLQIPRWDAEGFRVAVLSDLHSNFKHAVERTQGAIRLAIDAKPDLIAIPGDFIDYSGPEHLGFIHQSLKPLADARCPVVATLGNHDYWTKNPNRVIETIQQSHLQLLRNETVELDGVTIAGVDDAIAGRERYDFLEGGRHSKSLLAFFHEPDYVVHMPRSVSLQVSGHSHGGQICLPGGFAVHCPVGAHRYTAGYYPAAKVPLYVTRGVGTTGPDLRMFCPPEVSVLTLRSA